MASEPTTMSWSPPIYSLSVPPKLKHIYDLQSENVSQNFARSAKWTPDGSMFLAHCENRSLQLFMPTLAADSSRAQPKHVIHQPAPILDFAWYPTASPNDPASFCFLASVRDCPVKLHDASDGRLRASYKIIDHRERFVAPHAMSFNPAATNVYCGHEDAIEVFDVSRPGEGTRLSTTPSRKSKDGLKGIVSALSFSPSYSAESDAFYAAGTLSPSISNLALYSESQGNVPLMFLGGGARAGVTQLRFNPMKPHILYAAFRRREAIYAWDIRSDVNLPIEKFTVKHKPKTNQRMYFDVDISGQRLSVGDLEGFISVFDLSHGEDVSGMSDTSIRQPDLEFRAHEDSVGSVAFHPYDSVMLSVSGSRHYPSSDSEEDSSDDFDGKEVVFKSRQTLQPVTTDSRIKTWDLSPEIGPDG